MTKQVVFLGAGRLGSVALASMVEVGIAMAQVFVASSSDLTEAVPDLSVARTAERYGLAWRKMLRSTESTHELSSIGADLMVVASCPFILRPEALSSVGQAVNFHPSLLPRHRGPCPFFWVLRDGEAATGVTLHHMDAGVDTGPILWQRILPVEPGISGEQLVHQTRCLIKAEGGRTVMALLEGRLTPRPQPAGQETYEGQPHWEDLRIEPHMSLRRVYSFVKGVVDWVPVYVRAGEETIQVLDAILMGQGDEPIGEIVTHTQPGWAHWEKPTGTLGLKLGERIDAG